MVSGVGVLDPLVVGGSLGGGVAAYQLYLVHSPPCTLSISISMVEIQLKSSDTLHFSKLKKAANKTFSLSKESFRDL